MHNNENYPHVPDFQGDVAELRLACDIEREEDERADRRFRAWKNRQPITPDLIFQNGTIYIL